MPRKPVATTVFTLCAMLFGGAPSAFGQDLVEQDFRKWTIVNPVVQGQPQFRFQVTSNLIRWNAIRGRNWRLLAGANTTVTVPQSLANQPLRLDVQTYGGSSGIERMMVKLGSRLSYVEAQSGAFVNHQFVTLPAGKHKLEVLAKGSNLFDADINLITRASLVPLAGPAVFFRIPASPNSGPWFDVTVIGQAMIPPTLALIYVSPTRLPQGVSIPGVRGALFLGQPTLALPLWLDAGGSGRYRPPLSAWQGLYRTLSTPSYWQVVRSVPRQYLLGTPTTLVAR